MFAPYPAPVLGPAREAVDYEWYRDRLADPAQADRGIGVSVYRLPLLVVPIGGRRRGGYYATEQRAVALAVLAALAGEPGFPNLRVRRPQYTDCHTLRWGAPGPPVGDDVACGRFYGYSDTAIADFLGEEALRRAPGFMPLPRTDWRAARCTR
ncbi:DUF6302 family protein [Streptomyces sp. NPDC093093]|uniref:DUF6302 family protein n=1 Tax=Streptomyces sp. NPDC093093 TaxID=3366025 RepID=UPI00380A5DDE